ncbi:Gfo/Idh/MocA family oxidoreductase [Pseudomonas sp. CDFA 553]|uniref:Gfo/Idh/MocA family protein n=1 Tax=Pseudomonas quasicaspiana TaxID=2829821 RepID=UPI001E29B056|nr:Gfo/Idh/MocA family oxidoreductase [Pseudomonas quasicaspiana]MCD5987013.1 Gfo/Idh/MocA family oxidoreductase [Pseudomonas quasicaspiana]
MKVGDLFLVIGSGSIARRHMANIKGMYPGARVGCLSASGRVMDPAELGEDVVIYSSMDNAIADRPTSAIVASPAPFHIEQAEALVRAGVPVLIEKPLADSLQRFKASADLLLEEQDTVVIAYNLRFMPSAGVTKQIIDSGQLGHIHSVSVDVGQYLPDWRPASDYRKNVSAQHKLGGGVLLELSHELDYLQWLFGPLQSVYCVARTSGALELDVEDLVDAFLTSECGVVINLHMDFLQRAPVRCCKVIAEHGSLEWNILKNRVTLHLNASESTVLFDDADYDRNQMYVDELAHFQDVANRKSRPFVTVAQGLSTLTVVDALKRSSATGAVVSLKDFS